MVVTKSQNIMKEVTGIRIFKERFCIFNICCPTYIQLIGSILVDIVFSIVPNFVCCNHICINVQCSKRLHNVRNFNIKENPTQCAGCFSNPTMKYFLIRTTHKVKVCFINVFGCLHTS